MEPENRLSKEAENFIQGRQQPKWGKDIYCLWHTGKTENIGHVLNMMYNHVQLWI